HDWATVSAFLTSQNVLQWQVRTSRSAVSAKAKLGYRVVTQLDPLDFLMFAATIKEVAEDFEQRRIATEKHIVFSYRYLPDDAGRLFDPMIGYPQFVERTGEILDSNE